MTSVLAAGTCGAVAPRRIMPWPMGPVEQAPLEQAMARFAAGDDAALGDVYDLASPAVFRFLGKLCRDQAQAEDLTQETFLRIHRARGLYRPGAAVLPWAYTIARRLFLDAVRARKAEPLRTAGRTVTKTAASGHETDLDVVAALPAEEPTAEQLLADRQLARAIDEALARIPERQAVAFRLLKSEGLSVAETAAVMGTTQGAVKLRAHRAYEALRALLAARFRPPTAKRRADGRAEGKADGGTR